MQIRDFMTIIERFVTTVLNEEPSLAPAVKILSTGKIYRGQPGQMHHEVAEENGIFGMGWKYNPDIELGFINHKGHFLTRSRALDYAVTHDLMHDTAKRYIATDGTPAELGASFLKKKKKLELV